MWAYLAWEYERLHDPRATATFQHASDMADKALTREGQSPTIIADLSYFYAKLGRKPKGIEFAKQATLLAPANNRVLWRTALTFEICGMRDQALKNVAAAIQNGLATEKITADSEFKALVQDPRYALIDSAKQKNTAH